MWLEWGIGRSMLVVYNGHNRRVAGRRAYGPGAPCLPWWYAMGFFSFVQITQELKVLNPEILHVVQHDEIVWLSLCKLHNK